MGLGLMYIAKILLLQEVLNPDLWLIPPRPAPPCLACLQGHAEGPSGPAGAGGGEGEGAGQGSSKRQRLRKGARGGGTTTTATTT